MSISNQRQSNIELLRIIAILGVIVLHYNYGEIGGALTFVEKDSCNQQILFFLESMFICAVNLFFIISGFFLSNSYQRSVRKPLELLIQVILFQVGAYIGRVVMASGENLSLWTLVANSIPTNYFVTFYIVLYFLSPYINRLLDSIEYKEARRLIILLIVLFSVYCTFGNILSDVRGAQFMGLDSVGLEGNQAGYTIVNFAVMYIIGAFIRRYRINERIQSWKLGLLYLVCVVLLVIWATFESRQQNLLYNNSWIYCNPIVIAEAVIAFLFFLNLKIKIYPVINKLGSGVFTVFLLHSYFLEHIEIEKYVKGNSILMIGHIILSSVTIFALCTLIHFGYHAIMDPVYNHAFKRWNPIIVYLETGHEP